MTYKAWFQSVRRDFLMETLAKAKGNQLAAADALGIHRNTLFRMLREDGITPRMVADIRRAQPVNHTAIKTTIHYSTRSIHRVSERNPQPCQAQP